MYARPVKKSPLWLSVHCLKFHSINLIKVVCYLGLLLLFLLTEEDGEGEKEKEKTVTNLTEESDVKVPSI